MFTASIHDAARAIEPSARGELEITDAIQMLIDSGLRVEPHIVRGWWKDTGRLEDMLEANRLILDNQVERIEGELVDSQVEGRVVIEAGAQARADDRQGPGDRRGRGPAAATATSAPTPPSARAARSRAPRSSTRSCSRAAPCTGLDGRMESSLLGRGVTIRRGERQPRAYRFMVGDSSDISIL